MGYSLKYITVIALIVMVVNIVLVIMLAVIPSYQIMEVFIFKLTGVVPLIIIVDWTILSWGFQE